VTASSELAYELTGRSLPPAEQRVIRDDDGWSCVFCAGEDRVIGNRSVRAHSTACVMRYRASAKQAFPSVRVWPVHGGLPPEPQRWYG
jgi:hypothetical protein